jgi:hypothetical protein
VRAPAAGALQGGIGRAGMGRKPPRVIDPTLVSNLERIVDPSPRGDPMSPLKWTTTSLRKLASALQDMGHCLGRDVVGKFKNSGREWLPSGSPETVRVHNFIGPKLGPATTYDVEDIAAGKGWVSVGTDPDTATFTVNAIRSWWTARTREPKVSSAPRQVL